MESTKLGKYKIVYTNSKEYHTLKREIWGEDIYSFNSEKDSPLIIDIGAHIGISVLYFKSIYPNSKILAFEPNPISFEILNENVESNSLENVELFNTAISTNDGITKLYIDNGEHEWHSNSSLLENSWNGKEKTKPIEVKCSKLNNYLQGTEVIDMLKIDTEGSEYSILNSNKEILRKVLNICVEYHPVKGSKISRILSILQPYFDISIYSEGKFLKNPIDGKLLTIHGKKRE